MNISERFCPVCKNKNEYDAHVCRHCGALLDKYPPEAGGRTRTADVQTPFTERSRALPLEEITIPSGVIAIFVEGLLNPVSLCSEEKFIVGRKVSEPSDIGLDLSPLGGYHLGVSRRHVLIQRMEDHYEVTDLSSSNGTWLNDERLIPNQAYTLASGSQLRLGRMRFSVLYRSVVEARHKS